MDRKSLLITGGFLDSLAVILGAFAAHGLKPLLTIEAYKLLKQE